MTTRKRTTSDNAGASLSSGSAVAAGRSGGAPLHDGSGAQAATEMGWVTHALGNVGLALAILDVRGGIVAPNAAFVSALSDLLRRDDERFEFDDVKTDSAIKQSIAELRSAEQGPRACTVPLRRGRVPIGVGYLASAPINPALSDPGGYVLLVVPVQQRIQPDLLMLQNLFELSPAEARVAAGIVGNQTLEQMAGVFRVSRETLRSQLKSVLLKTGARRQLDLALLLASLQIGCL